MSGDDKRMRKYLEELYKDKKYFDYYINTEALPTNAAVETRFLANHGREFLVDRAQYWKENQPPPDIPLPADLRLPKSRMHTLGTLGTAADSGMEATGSERPFSADDAVEGMPVAAPRSHRGKKASDKAKELTKKSSLPTVHSDRVSPPGRTDGQTTLKEKSSSDGTNMNANISTKAGALSMVEMDQTKHAALPGSAIP